MPKAPRRGETEFFIFFSLGICIYMPKRRGLRKGGRRLQPTAAALMGSTIGAGLAGLGAHVATTFTGLKKKGRGPDKSPRARRGNLRGAPVMRRAVNTEGYIPPFSLTIGTPKSGLSFAEKIQKIMNPPQVYLFNSTQKLEAGSGRQGVSGFTITNNLLENFFSLMAANKSDNSTNQTPYVDAAAQTNTVNHLWSSVQHTFLNSGNTACELDIYVYKSLQDQESTDQARTASAAWSHAESINTAAGIAADGTDKLAKKPTDGSSRFYVNRYWRLLSKNSVTMKPGESYKHYVRHHLNKQIAKFAFNGDTSDGVVKDHCLSYIFVCKGQVVNNSINAEVSTADCQITCVRSLKLSHCFANTVRPRNYLVGTDLPVIISGNQTWINADSSVATTGYFEDT